MSDSGPRTVRANGLSHLVRQWGDEASAHTFVLCHGFLDQSLSFRGVGERLAERGARAFAFDWRGHGQTEWVGAGGYYHFVDYVLDLHELLPQLTEGPVHLCGHSMGGTAVAMFAATHPERLRTVTLVEGLGPPGFGGEAPDKILDWLQSVDRVRRGDPKKPMTDLDDAVRRLRGMNKELPEPLARELASTGTQPGPNGEGLVWSFDPLHRTTSPSVFDAAVFETFLRRIAAPTLIVNGQHGFRTPDHAARVAALPNAVEITIESAGHMIHQSQPVVLADAIFEHALAHG
ncbi:MAG: alpha/beta fold hydrolase [Sandaracinaceae bacterium]